MNVVLQVLIATTLIAAMIVVRVIANRYRLRQKLHCEHHPGQCAGPKCAKETDQERSACHAP